MIIGSKRKKSVIIAEAEKRIANFEVKRKKSKTIGTLSEYTEKEDLEYDEDSHGIVAECPETHDLKDMIDVTIPGSAQKVNEMLFTSKSSWFKNFLVSQNYTNMNLGTFEESEGETKRLFTYTMPVKGNLGPKTANVKELLTKCRSCKEGSTYAYNGEVTNSGIPYQDAFYLASHFCITNQGPSKCRFYMGLEVRYKKSVWGMVKNMIEKSSYGQCVEVYTEMTKALSASLIGKSEKDQKTKSDDPETPNKNTGLRTSSFISHSYLVMWVLIGLLMLFNLMLYRKIGSVETTGPAVMRSNSQPVREIDISLSEGSDSIESVEDVREWRNLMRIVIRELKKNEVLIEALRHQMVIYESKRLLEEDDELLESLTTKLKVPD